MTTDKHEFEKVICELSEWLRPRDAYRDALSSDEDKTQLLKILRAIVCPEALKATKGARKEMSLEDKANDWFREACKVDKDLYNTFWLPIDSFPIQAYSKGYKQAIKDLIERAQAKCWQPGYIAPDRLELAVLEQAAEDLIKERE